MLQNPKRSNGIELDYATPSAAVELVRQLAAENDLLVSYDLETARISKAPPVEFALERSGVVDGGYCILLERPKRIA